MKSITTIITIIATIILAGGALFIFTRGGDDADNTTRDLFKIDFAGQADVQDDISMTDESDEKKDSGNTADGFEAKPQNRLLYTNDKYKFSFEYGKDVTASFFNEGVGDMVLIQRKNGGESAQIFITPYDEPEPITSERILKDLPDMVIKNEKDGTIGESSAIAFSGKHESMGDTYEIWFIKDESLYQIMTKIETAQFLIGIMKTWKEI